MGGRSLLPLATSPSTWTGRSLFLTGGPTEVGGPDQYHGVRTARFKHIEYATGERELYDLLADPDELVNLVTDPS